MENLFDLSGKVAVVTGGTGVLGGSIAGYLACQGVRVAVLGRTPGKVEEKVREIEAAGNQVLGYTCDILKKEHLKEVCSQILKVWGRVDILVNAAGGNLPGATLEEEQTIFDMDFSAFKQVTDLNLNGTVLPCLVFGEAMAKQLSGCIINVSSMASNSAITRVPGYSAAKSAIENFTQWLAMEMALKFSDKIRVNAIAPGFFIGNQNRSILINPDGSLTERSRKVLARTPMKRFGDIFELNGTVHYLSCDASSFVTGAIVPVDGGFSFFSGV